MKDFQITFYPIGKKVILNKPTTILDAARIVDLDLSGPCGGQGKCGKCKIRIMRYPDDIYRPPDPVSKELLTETQLKKGYRLACTYRMDNSFGIELPSWIYESDECVNIDVVKDYNLSCTKQYLELINKFGLDPVVKYFECDLPKPSIDDNISDLERLTKYLDTNLNIPPKSCEFINMKVSNAILKTISKDLRDSNWNFQIILALTPYETELLDIKPIENTKTGVPKQNNVYGIALDVGTSTLVAYLLDLSTGEQISAASCVNPQIRIGADVIARIRYSSHDSSGNADQQLTNILIEAINKLISKVCSITGVDRNNIYEIAAMGNTVMLHNLVGIPLSNLGSAPYTPVIEGNSYFKTSKQNLNLNNNGILYLGPMVSGFLGADAVGTALIAGMLQNNNSAENEELDKVKLALDIGTNGEILLYSNSRLLACSAAAGPAFEGTNLRFGMRAVPGAVYKVKIKNRKIYTEVFNGISPIGITGSGVLDAINEFLKAGAISHNGNINPNIDKKWLRLQKSKNLGSVTEPTESCELILPELLIVPKHLSGLNTSITLNQDDIREIQLAKAAIRAGIDILLLELGLNYDEIDEIYLAGAFGNYLDPRNAISIGLLPDISLNKIHSIGNSAGASAKLLLRSSKARDIAKQIANKIEYIDLAMRTDFQDIFIDNMVF